MSRGKKESDDGGTNIADTSVADANEVFKIHLLDIGEEQYGDCVLCQFGDESVLIDGAHRGDDDLILKQLQRLLQQQTLPVRVSLLIVTHPHDDHIGCFPSLIASDQVRAEWALVADPKFRWGEADETNDFFAGRDYRARALTEALLEEDRSGWPDAALSRFIDNVGSLSSTYRTMLRQLTQRGTKVVRNGSDDLNDLLTRFNSIGLKVIGPSRAHLEEAARLLLESRHDSLNFVEDTFATDTTMDTVSAYRNFLAGVADRVAPNKGAINLQSIVTRFEFKGERLIFAGDMQFNEPEVESDMLVESVQQMRQAISAEAPYSFVKLSHHASYNGFSAKILADLGESKLYGICCGHYDPKNSHPHPDVLQLLDQNRDRLKWVRTDHNNLVTITFGAGGPKIKPGRGEVNDATLNHEVTDVHDELDMLIDSVQTGSQADASVQPVSELVAKALRNATRLSLTVDLTPATGTTPQGSLRETVDSADAAADDELAFATADTVRNGTPSRDVLAQQFNRAKENGWVAFFSEAAQRFNWPTSLLLAIASRESNIKSILGDAGHGHGIMQIDDRSFPDFTNSNDWKVPRLNILKGAEVLNGKRRFLSQKGVNGATLMRASVAAYNCGEGNALRAIRRGLDIDFFTAHRNYSADVLARAAIFKDFLG